MSDLTWVIGTEAGFTVHCHQHGDVTRLESHFTVDGPVSLQQATLYRQRHLAVHLAALAEEIRGTTR